ncbi:MAG TPA: demethoxyubiquinone hydroxylase family protein [Vicinamibacteria bacterium]|nr:demethoxyubiquinone hydroxylase family protein [Vicinamibacteria bacterium]
MAKTVDFATLSLKDALDLAILMEEEARERYLEFADQMEIHHTQEAASFFRRMAENEAKHGRQLSERRQAAFPGQPRAVKRSMLWDVEAPDYDAARAFMSVRQAMEVALDAERKAHDFFQWALPHLKDAEVTRLFEELREEESQHQELVRAQLAGLPLEPDADADDYADEPVGH